MQRKHLVLLAVLLALTSLTSVVWAQGAWVFVEAKTSGEPRSRNNPQWKYEVDCDGLSHRGKLSSDAWRRAAAGAVSWGGAPPQTLAPGRKYPVNASLSLRDIKGKGNDIAQCNVALGLWRSDGSFAGDAGGLPKGKDRGRISKPMGKSQVAGAWSQNWTAPKGRPGLLLHVDYASGNPGGSCSTTFVYRWDASATAGATPEKRPAPLKVSLSTAKQRIVVGEKVMVSAKVSGGEPPYRYLWLGKTSSKSGRVRYHSKTPGRKTVSVEVSDAAGSKASAKLELTVVAKPQEPPLAVSLHPDSQSVVVNQKLMVTAKTQNGKPPFRYIWQGQTETRENRVVFTMPDPGPKLIEVAVTDSAGQTARASLQVDVIGPGGADKPGALTVKLISTPAEGPDAITKVLVHQLVTVRAVVSGGSGRYRYQWSGDRGWTKKNPSTVTYVASHPQEPNLSVQVFDEKTGQRGSDSLRVRVMGVEARLSHAGPPINRIPAGQLLTLTVTVTGHTFKPGDELYGKPLYVLWQPHPEVDFQPFEGQCPRMSPCGLSTRALFTEPGPKTVWAELMAVDGPQKIIVGEATLELNVVP